MTDDARIFATADCTVYIECCVLAWKGILLICLDISKGALYKKNYSAYMIIHNAYMHA